MPLLEINDCKKTRGEELGARTTGLLSGCWAEEEGEGWTENDAWGGTDRCRAVGQQKREKGELKTMNEEEQDQCPY